MNQEALKQWSIISTEIIFKPQQQQLQWAGNLFSVGLWFYNTQYPRYSYPVDVIVFNVKGVWCHCAEKMASESFILCPHLDEFQWHMTVFMNACSFLVLISFHQLCLCSFFSINFNQDASLICVSSDHGTVHIFAAEDPKRNKQSRLVSAFRLYAVQVMSDLSTAYQWSRSFICIK